MVVSFLRWHQPQLRPPQPCCLASKLLSSVQAGLSAQWLPQKLNKFSPIDQIHPLTAQTRATCNERFHWPTHSQVSVLGQSLPASHWDTILSIRTAEKDHVGPQLSQVYKTMLLKISKTQAMKSSYKVILKPQCCLLRQNFCETVQLLSSHFSSRAVSVVSGVGCCSDPQQWRSHWGKLGLKIRPGNQVIWRLWLKKLVNVIAHKCVNCRGVSKSDMVKTQILRNWTSLIRTGICAAATLPSLPAGTSPLRGLLPAPANLDPCKPSYRFNVLKKLNWKSVIS